MNRAQGGRRTSQITRPFSFLFESKCGGQQLASIFGNVVKMRGKQPNSPLNSPLNSPPLSKKAIENCRC